MGKTMIFSMLSTAIRIQESPNKPNIFYSKSLSNHIGTPQEERQTMKSKVNIHKKKWIKKNYLREMESNGFLLWWSLVDLSTC